MKVNQVQAWQQGAAMLYGLSGGYGDATGYLLAQTFTGHVTGNLVLLALALGGGHWAAVLPRLVAVVCFMAATAIGFLMVGWNRARATSLMFLLQGAVLLPLCTEEVRRSGAFSLSLIVALCVSLGLQNGVVTSVAGVGLHATFLSGDVTTLLGKLVKGREAKGKPESGRAIPVLLGVIGSFLAGAIAARLLAGPLGRFLPVSLLLPLLAAMLVSERVLRLERSAEAD